MAFLCWSLQLLEYTFGLIRRIQNCMKCWVWACYGHQLLFGSFRVGSFDPKPLFSYFHTFIISPNSESGRKILNSDHLLMALTNRFVFVKITNQWHKHREQHEAWKISSISHDFNRCFPYLDTKNSAHASRTLFNCKKAAPTINVWTFWFSIFTHPLYAKLIKLSSALKTDFFLVKCGNFITLYFKVANLVEMTQHHWVIVLSNAYCGSISFIVISLARLSAMSVVNIA